MVADLGINTLYSISNGDIIRLWIMRIAILLNGYKTLITDHGFDDDNIAREIGLKKWIANAADEKLHKQIHRDLKKNLSKMEGRASEIFAPDTLVKNVDKLGQLLNLSENDKRVLELSILIHTEPMLSDATDWVGEINLTKLYTCIAVVLGIPLSEIKTSLSRNGQLLRSGIISIDLNHFGGIRYKLDVISLIFAEQMLLPIDNPISLFQETILTCDAPKLSLADFEHISESLDILIPYLRHVASNRKKGVNVLLYGDPGTGKSQLSRLLAKELSLQLFEISFEDEDGDAISAIRRLRAYRAAQNMFSCDSTLLLFDEIEDIFNDGIEKFSMVSTAKTHKGWINSTLEENPVPTLWLSNDIKNMDPAFIRRFDIIIELIVPPHNKRRILMEETYSDILPKSSINKISAHDHLTPAVVDRAYTVITSIKNDLPRESLQKSFEHLIDKTLIAQGHHALSLSKMVKLPIYYDPYFVSTNIDLLELKNGIFQSKSGRICIYGPPGTGKTAYAHWLASQLDIPIHIKRASDLLSMWLGETEKAISDAFKDAENDNAMLVIDEIDSFLQHRLKASHSWEVTSVNEMLTQMEAFSGIFIATTNLISGLDQASMRRFDLKMKFDYLKPEQAWRMLENTCGHLELDSPEKTWKAKISMLNNLTLGDFRTISRRHTFNRFESSFEVIEALEVECNLKEDSKKWPMGFV